MKTAIYTALLIMLSLVISSEEKASYSIIEGSLPLVLGATLGGVLACVSIIVGVLSSSSKNTKRGAKNSQAFSNFVKSLEVDVKVLVLCLFSAVLLPYLRTLEYPVTIQFLEYSPEYLKDKLFSSAEIFVGLIAFFAIFEIVSVVVGILGKMMTLQDSGNEGSEGNNSDP